MFIHLHCHSHYSFLDGAMSPADLVETAKAHGMNAIALTDTGNMCGLVEFATACKKEEIKPIFGADLWTIPHDWAPEKETLKTPAPGYLLTFLVKNESGYRNICQLVSMAHRQRNFTPRITLEQLTDHAEGLIVLCGAYHGPIGLLPSEEHTTELARLKSIYGPNLFLELVEWGVDNGEANDRIRELSAQLGIETVVTNNARYVDSKGTVLLNLMHGIALGHTLANPLEITWHNTDQATLKTKEEITKVFSADARAIERSGEIAEQCNYELELGTPFLPNSQPPAELTSLKERWSWLINWFPPPKIFGNQQEFTAEETTIPEGWDLVDQYFAWYARKGLEKRLELEPASVQFATAKAYRQRLEMELGVIQRMKFSAYHLIVGEFINWAKDNGISVGPGRGSAAGSVVTWAMRITDINPLQFGLMFERYLNPKRISMPDIDVDFEQERREEVIDHAREKYGDAQVCQILTVGTMKAKAALKDCARACGTHFGDANSWSKEIEEGPKIKLSEALEGSRMKNLMNGNPQFRHVARLALAMEKRPRQTGIHAAGVIITSRPITEFAPMHFEPTKNGPGKTMTGVEMNAAEKLGLVKFDFLGLKTLDIIKQARNSVFARTGELPEILDPLFDDPAVFELLGEGDSLGLFQVESHGMQDLLQRMHPDDMEDIVAIQALYRPGPLGSGMVDDYVEVKHGRKKVEYPHPLLEEVLRPTNGVMVYQEQVMKAAQVLAGYDLGGADLLRRAMGKKKQKEMDAQKVLFIDGCVSNGVTTQDAERIFGLINYFAGYGFNKSHSASYGVICYSTCKLKAHHRADLMAAAMSFEYNDRDKLVSYVNDCKRVGIPVLGPDIHQSQVHFSVEPHQEAKGGLAIRYGLRAIKGLGEAALEQLLEARQSAPFSNLQDLRARAKANKTTVQALVYSGALDSFGNKRFDLWWEINRPAIKPIKTKAGAAQISLFGGKTLAEEESERQTLQEAEAKPRRWTYSQHLDHEHNALGIWISGHPLVRFSDIENRGRNMNIPEIGQFKPGTPITIVGVVTKIHRIDTRNGNKMGYFTIADRLGTTEVVLRPVEWKRYNKIIERGECVIVQGKLDRGDSRSKLVVSELETLWDRRNKMAYTLDLEIPAKCSITRFDQLISLIQRHITQNRRIGKTIRIKVYHKDANALLHPYVYGHKGHRLDVINQQNHQIDLVLHDNPLIEPSRELYNEVEYLTEHPNALHLPGPS